MTPQTDRIDHPEFLEKHYTLEELAKAWHISRPTLRSWEEFRHLIGAKVWWGRR